MKIYYDVVQGTPEWNKIRAGVPTASALKKLITVKEMRLSEQASGYASFLAAERFKGAPVKKFKGDYNTERGHELEPDAVKLYEMITGNEVTHAGFIKEDDGSFGASPDGLIGEEGGLELKAPEEDTHVEYLYNGVLPCEYKWQVHGNLYVSKRKWWDFMSYAPAFPPFKIRVYPDEEMNEKLAAALKKLNEMVEIRLNKIKGEIQCPVQ